MARLLREGRDRVEERTGRRPGQRVATWPADLRNAAKDTESPGDRRSRSRAPGGARREPACGRQEALF